MAETTYVRVVRRARQIEPGVALLVVGLAVACYLQGAFFPRAQAIVAVPLVLAALFAPKLPVLTRPDLPIICTAAGLVGWAVVDGLLTGHVLAGFHYLFLVASVVGLALVCRQLPAAARTMLRNGLLVISCAVAVSGWFGVLIHAAPWGFDSVGMWRASSSLTYPNAAAAILTMAALVCLALRTQHPAGRWSGAAATILLAGLAATLSRAGIGALAVGLVLVGFGAGWRPLLRAIAGPLLGALIALTGLLPALAAGTPTTVTTVLISVAAAAVGLVVGARVPANRGTIIVLTAVLVGAAVLLSTRVGSRFTLDSPDRWGSFQVAWNLFVHHPVIGVGPGIDRLVLTRPTGVTVYRFVHNEYLQVLAELGIVGAVLLLAFLAAVVRRLWRDRTGALAAFVALLLHAGFDFVWHIPAVPLLGAAFVGLAMTRTNNTNEG